MWTSSIEDQVIVELKTVSDLALIHERQVLTQLKLSGLPVGLLINFNVPVLVDGVKRIVNPILKSRETQPEMPRGDGERA